MKKYYEIGYDGELIEIKDIYDELHTVIENEIVDEKEYDDMLDECYDVVKIGEYTFYPSQILYNCDKVAYDIGYSEYIDSMVEDYKYDLDLNEYIKIGSVELVYKDDNVIDDKDESRWH